MKAMHEQHGYSSAGARHPMYSIWVGMIHRCHGKTPQKNYGGRGIKVCKRWRYSFSKFLTDMGERPIGMTLDRRNNNGNYTPANCRWATLEEQGQNTSKTRLMTFGKTTLGLRAWARKHGITNQAMQWRLKNWPQAKALSVRVNERARYAGKHLGANV